MLGKRERVAKMALRTAAFCGALISVSRFVFMAQLVGAEAEDVTK